MAMPIQAKGVNQLGAEVDLLATEGGVLYTSPIQTLWTAKGYGFQAMATSAVAGQVARPTTTAVATLRNCSSDKVLVIERVFAHNLVAAAQSDYGIWLCVNVALSTADSNDITVRNSTNGSAAGGSETTFDAGATVADGGWFPWGYSYTTVTVTTPGGQLIAEVGGRLMVQPQGDISVAVVSSVNTATFCCGFHWFEVPLSELLVS